MDLHIAGALELLKDDFVHSASGIDQGRRDDRQASAIFDIARGSEKFLRLMQRIRIDTAGKYLTARRNHRIVCARQAGNAI